MARKLSKIVVKNLKDMSGTRADDSAELYRLGKAALRTIQFRRWIMKHRPGPNRTEKKELDRLELQVLKIMEKLGKRSGQGQSKLAHSSEVIKRLVEAKKLGKMRRCTNRTEDLENS